MSRPRKNVNRIDPRYFLSETTHRDLYEDIPVRTDRYGQKIVTGLETGGVADFKTRRDAHCEEKFGADVGQVTRCQETISAAESPGPGLCTLKGCVDPKIEYLRNQMWALDGYGGHKDDWPDGWMPASMRKGGEHIIRKNHPQYEQWAKEAKIDHWVKVTQSG